LQGDLSMVQVEEFMQTTKAIAALLNERELWKKPLTVMVIA
jgi:hypothetical protein